MTLRATPQQLAEQSNMERIYGANPQGGLFGSLGGGIRYGSNGPQMQPEAAQPEQRRPGLGSRLFGSGWESKLAAFGGLLAGDQHAVARYHGQQQQERQLAEQRAFEQQQASQARQTDWADWVQRQEYTRNNPEPRAPDAFDIALQRGGIDPNSEQGREMYRQRAESMARDPNDQWVSVPIPGQGTYFGPQSGLAQIYGRPAAEAPETLPPDFSFAPPRANGSAPPMNARRSVTPAQFTALVADVGPQEAERQLRSGELMIGGQ